MTDWAFKSQTDILQDPTHLSVINAVKNKLISLLLLARLNAFADIGNIKSIMSNQPGWLESKDIKKAREKRERQDMDDMVKNILSSTELERWEQANVTNYREKHDRNPSRMQWSLRHAQHPPSYPAAHLVPIFQGLSHTHFNWMASKDKTDHLQHRARITKSIVKEYYYWDAIRRELIEGNEDLFRLFSQLSHTITSCSLLQDWEIWLPFTKELEADGYERNEKEEDGLDRKIETQVLLTFQAEKKHKLERLYRDFARNLSQHALCGLKEEDQGSSLLHPALQRSLKQLHKVNIFFSCCQITNSVIFRLWLKYKMIFIELL